MFPADGSINIAYFRERFGHIEVPVTSNAPEADTLPCSMPLGKFLDTLVSSPYSFPLYCKVRNALVSYA